MYFILNFIWKTNLFIIIINNNNNNNNLLHYSTGIEYESTQCLQREQKQWLTVNHEQDDQNSSSHSDKLQQYNNYNKYTWNIKNYIIYDIITIIAGKPLCSSRRIDPRQARWPPVSMKLQTIKCIPVSINRGTFFLNNYFNGFLLSIYVVVLLW